MEIAQFVLLVIGWTVAFLLGRELQHGYRLWRGSRERGPLRQPSKD